MTLPPLLLDFALRQRRLTRYGAFCAEYKKTARALDPELAQEVPSRAQLHRWVTGGLKRLPYTDHCRVLEAMFPEWSVEQLFAPCPPEVLAADRPPAATDADRADLESRADRDGIAGFADVTAVYPTRAEFTFALPPHTLFDGARDIRMAGLSLNLLCQQYPDNRLHRLVESGTTLHCLFLDPEGGAIQAREREEGYRDRHLTTLTRLNIETITRLRDRLSDQARDRLTVATYDEVIRFNITLIDGEMCIMQPYLPQARGVDSPTFVIQRTEGLAGLYGTYEQVFTSLAERSSPV